MIRSRTRTVFSFLALSFFAAAAAGYGCGSSSGGGGGDPKALCEQGCDKGVALCSGDAGAEVAAAASSLCKSACASQTATVTSCKNESAIVAAYQKCLNQTTCEGLMTCAGQIPACEGGTGSAGTGGTTGGAGTTGHGGTTGSAGTTGAGNRGGASGLTGFGGFAGNILGGGGSFLGGGGFGGGITIAGTCADLLACCGRATGTTQTTCMSAYTSAMASGDTGCGAVLGFLKSSTCP